MKHYLSFGGGVNSVALYLLMQDLGMDFEAIFVDHGADYPETYEYMEYFIESGRPITILRPEYHRKKDDRTYNDLYEYCWDYEMVPSMMARWCTRIFKVVPVNRYVERPCFMHLGIDAGEQKRATLNVEKGIENRWMLIEHDIDREGCKKLIAKGGLKVPPKSGCWFCPYQRVAQWRKLRRNYPDLFCKAQKLEERNAKYRVRKGKKPFSLRGNGKFLKDFIGSEEK